MIFAGCQPDISDGDIDLDTTYFPFGLGYEWCYENDNWYSLSGWGPDQDTSWEKYDTFTFKVTDSSWVGDTLLIKLDRSMGGLENPVRFFDYEINIYWTRINIINPNKVDTVIDCVRYKVGCDGKTLEVSTTEYSPYVEDWFEWKGSVRSKGVGATRDGSYASHYDDGISESYGSLNRLLWFYNGKDTVYKAP